MDQVCNELWALVGDDEYNDLEEVRGNVDDCIARAMEQLER